MISEIPRLRLWERELANCGVLCEENGAHVRLGGLVGSLLQLAVVGRLLDEIEDLLAESLVGLGPRGAVVGHCRFGCGGGLGWNKGSLLSSPEGGFLQRSVCVRVGARYCSVAVLQGQWAGGDVHCFARLSIWEKSSGGEGCRSSSGCAQSKFFSSRASAGLGTHTCRAVTSVNR
jgi:hypothetical protein